MKCSYILLRDLVHLLACFAVGGRPGARCSDTRLSDVHRRSSDSGVSLQSLTIFVNSRWNSKTLFRTGSSSFWPVGFVSALIRAQVTIREDIWHTILGDHYDRRARFFERLTEFPGYAPSVIGSIDCYLSERSNREVAEQPPDGNEGFMLESPSRNGHLRLCPYHKNKSGLAWPQSYLSGGKVKWEIHRKKLETTQ